MAIDTLEAGKIGVDRSAIVAKYSLSVCQNFSSFDQSPSLSINRDIASLQDYWCKNPNSADLHFSLNTQSQNVNRS